MVEEGLHPEIIVHPKSLELLRKRVVGENHVMNLSQNKSVFIKRRPDLLRHLLSRRVVSSRSFGNRPSDGVHPTGRLESVAVKHGHTG